MNERTYTHSQILRHMTPSTLAAMISDLDDAVMVEAADANDLALMHAALTELFNIAGMEALTMLETYGVTADNPMVMAVVEAYNEGGE